MTIEVVGYDVNHYKTNGQAQGGNIILIIFCVQLNATDKWKFVSKLTAIQWFLVSKGFGDMHTIFTMQCKTISLSILTGSTTQHVL